MTVWAADAGMRLLSVDDNMLIIPKLLLVTHAASIGWIDYSSIAVAERRATVLQYGNLIIGMSDRTR